MAVSPGVGCWKMENLLRGGRKIEEGLRLGHSRRNCEFVPRKRGLAGSVLTRL